MKTPEDPKRISTPEAATSDEEAKVKQIFAEKLSELLKSERDIERTFRTAAEKHIEREWSWPRYALGLIAAFYALGGVAIAWQLINFTTTVETRVQDVKRYADSEVAKLRPEIENKFEQYYKQALERQDSTTQQLVNASRILAMVASGQSHLKDRHDAIAASEIATNAMLEYQKLLSDQNVEKSALNELYSLVWNLRAECNFALLEFSELESLANEALAFQAKTKVAGVREPANYYKAICTASRIFDDIVRTSSVNEEKLLVEVRESLQLFVESSNHGRIGFSGVRIAALELLIGEYSRAELAIDTYLKNASTMSSPISQASPEVRVQLVLAGLIKRIAMFALGKEELDTVPRCDLDPGAIGLAEGRFFESFFRAVAARRRKLNAFRRDNTPDFALEQLKKKLSDESGNLGKFCVDAILGLRRACSKELNSIGCEDCATNTDFLQESVILRNDFASLASLRYEIAGELGVIIHAVDGTPVTRSQSLGRVFGKAVWMKYRIEVLVQETQTREYRIGGETKVFPVTVNVIRTQDHYTIFQFGEPLPPMPYLPINDNDIEIIRESIKRMANVRGDNRGFNDMLPEARQ